MGCLCCTFISPLFSSASIHCHPIPLPTFSLTWFQVTVPGTIQPSNDMLMECFKGHAHSPGHWSNVHHPWACEEYEFMKVVIDGAWCTLSLRSRRPGAEHYLTGSQTSSEGIRQSLGVPTTLFRYLGLLTLSTSPVVMQQIASNIDKSRHSLLPYIFTHFFQLANQMVGYRWAVAR